MIVALLAPILANDRPLFCIYKNQWCFPVLSTTNLDYSFQLTHEWKQLNYDVVIWAPCVYSPTTSDIDNSYKGPFSKQLFKTKTIDLISMPYRYRHWLGTTQSGNDVLSGLIHGTRISVLIGLVSTLIATIIGGLLGSMAGYFGNKQFKLGWLSLSCLLLGWFLSYFYTSNFITDSSHKDNSNLLIYLSLSIVIIVVVTTLSYSLGQRFENRLKLKSKYYLLLDTIINVPIELINTLPIFLIILGLSAIITPSISNLILIISFINWTAIARITRAEVIRANNMNYVESAKSLGVPSFKIILHHILPNITSSIFVQMAFSISGAILIESTLSFLAVGLPADTVTWGSLLNNARENINAWWLVVFPGLAIFTIIFCCNSLGEKLRLTNTNR